MTCSEFEDLILDEIDGRITPETVAALRNHLAECGQCRAFHATQQDLERSLNRARVPDLPAHFSSRVLARLSLPDADWPRLGFLWDFAGVVSIAAAAGFGAAYLLPSDLVPNALAGAPWIAAGAALFAGAWLTLAEPPTPSA